MIRGFRRCPVSLILPVVLLLLARESVGYAAFIGISTSRDFRKKSHILNGKGSEDSEQMESSFAMESSSKSVPLVVDEEVFEFEGATLVCEEENCRLVFLDDEAFEGEGTFTLQGPQNQQESWSLNPVVLDRILPSKPIFLALAAFGTYDPVAGIFSNIVEWLRRDTTWVAVDGGAYQAQIIAPAINGVIVPAISLLFASLISTTISSLKQRQERIQVCLHLEAIELRILETCLKDLFLNVPSAIEEQAGASLLKCRNYLLQYSTRIASEADEAVDVSALLMDSIMDSEINGVIAELYRVSSGELSSDGHLRDSGNQAAAQLPPSSDLLWSQAVKACDALIEQRAQRITALQATFPVLHYALLSALGSSLLVVFLMETNQDILVFLNAIQLRLLWSIMVGTFSALGLVCYDLNQPFRGSYQITKGSIDQIYTVRKCLQTDLDLAVDRQ